jgi:hypothetical protein
LTFWLQQQLQNCFRAACLHIMRQTAAALLATIVAVAAAADGNGLVDW